MFENLTIEQISGLIIAAGALGTAAFAIVEGLKWLPFVGEFGFIVMLFRLGTLTEALEYAYGQPRPEMSSTPTMPMKSRKIKHRWWDTWSASSLVMSEELWDLLRAQYRGDQEKLSQFLRQGVRLGLTPATIERLASDLSMVNAKILKDTVQKIYEGDEGALLTAEERNVLGKFELAADARIEAALALAQSHYKGKLQVTAACIAILIALLASLSALSVGTIDFTSLQANSWSVLGRALFVGLLAVPVAPITHHIVEALKAVATAIGPKS